MKKLAKHAVEVTAGASLVVGFVAVGIALGAVGRSLFDKLRGVVGPTLGEKIFTGDDPIVAKIKQF